MAFRNNDCEFKRDCLRSPIPDKCFYFCIFQILQSANKDEKQFVIGLSRECSEAIYSAFNNFSLNRYEDLETRLTNEHSIEVIERFKKITQLQIDYFHTDDDFRNQMRRLLKRLREDME